jgi:hypothetical protein
MPVCRRTIKLSFQISVLVYLYAPFQSSILASVRLPINRRRPKQCLSIHIPRRVPCWCGGKPSKVCLSASRPPHTSRVAVLQAMSVYVYPVHCAPARVAAPLLRGAAAAQRPSSVCCAPDRQTAPPPAPCTCRRTTAWRHPLQTRRPPSELHGRGLKLHGRGLKVLATTGSASHFP